MVVLRPESSGEAAHQPLPPLSFIDAACAAAAIIGMLSQLPHQLPMVFFSHLPPFNSAACLISYDCKMGALMSLIQNAVNFCLIYIRCRYRYQPWRPSISKPARRRCYKMLILLISMVPQHGASFYRRSKRLP